MTYPKLRPTPSPGSLRAAEPIAEPIDRVHALIHYRPFLNWDPPALAEIWRNQPPLRGRMQPLTPTLLEELVLAKPFFDRNGLIVAVDGARPIGFVHAARGRNADGSGLSDDTGVITMLVTCVHERRIEVGIELLSAAEDFLKRQNLTKIFVGGAPPHDPFYLGLYGGVHGVGILDSDTDWADLTRSQGFEAVQAWQLWRRSLYDFRPVIDRRLLQLRRTFEIMTASDPPTENWWEACVWAHIVRSRVDVAPRSGGESSASAWLWDMQPLARTWAAHAAGIISIDDSPEARTGGQTLLLLTELMQNLQAEQVTVVEAATLQDDTNLAPLLKQLGFEPYETGHVYARPS